MLPMLGCTSWRMMWLCVARSCSLTFLTSKLTTKLPRRHCLIFPLPLDSRRTASSSIWKEQEISPILIDSLLKSILRMLRSSTNSFRQQSSRSTTGERTIYSAFPHVLKPFFLLLEFTHSCVKLFRISWKTGVTWRRRRSATSRLLNVPLVTESESSRQQKSAR